MTNSEKSSSVPVLHMNALDNNNHNYNNNNNNTHNQQQQLQYKSVRTGEK